MCSFLERVAELGDFVKFDFDLCHETLSVIPLHVAVALINAVAANQGLEELALHRANDQVLPYLEHIFGVAECHASLASLKLGTCPRRQMLKKLLNRNRNIQVIDSAESRLATNDAEIRHLYAFNDFVQDSQKFQMNSLSLLPSLLGEALTRCTSSDFRWSALLMADRLDALCQLVQHSSLFQLDAQSPDEQQELDGDVTALGSHT